MEYNDFWDYKFDDFNNHLIKMFVLGMKIMMQSTCRLIFVQFCWTVLKWRRDEPDFGDLPRMGNTCISVTNMRHLIFMLWEAFLSLQNNGCCGNSTKVVLAEYYDKGTRKLGNIWLSCRLLHRGWGWGGVGWGTPENASSPPRLPASRWHARVNQYHAADKYSFVDISAMHRDRSLILVMYE